MKTLDTKTDDKYMRAESLNNRISISNICKSYTSDLGVEHKVLNSVSFEIGQSEFVSIVGPSGCGKTTLLKIIAGLISPDSGQVTIGGDSPSKSRSSKSI